MANDVSPLSQQFSIPYLTLNEFKNAPTAIDIDNLVFNSTDPDAQDAELSNVIARASSYIDTFCNQILGASSDTEQQRTRIKRDGSIRFHPNNSPIVALTNLWYGSDPTQLTQMTDPSICWLESQQVIVPSSGLSTNYTSQGSLSLGSFTGNTTECYLKYTYVNGYANDTIVSATAGQTTLTVANGIGFHAGLMLKIYDGLNSENITIGSTYVFGSNTVPLANPLNYSHTTGVSISALPPAIKEAAILITTAMLKVRGDNSMVMNVTTSPGHSTPGSQAIASDIGMAQELLKPFRRIR